MRIASAFHGLIKMRPWHLFEKQAFLLVTCVIAALLAWLLWQRNLANAEMNDITQRNIEKSFVKIQPAKGGALMTPQQFTYFNIW